MNDFKTVRDALGKGKIVIGNEIVAGHKSYDDVYSYFCKAMSIIDRMIETPAPTEKVERIEGLFDAISIEDLPPPNTDKECDNITKRYEDHIDIYGCAVNETLLEAARAYLKLQSGETEKVDVDKIIKDVKANWPWDKVNPDFVPCAPSIRATISVLSNTGRLR